MAPRLVRLMIRPAVQRRAANGALIPPADPAGVIPPRAAVPSMIKPLANLRAAVGVRLNPAALAGVLLLSQKNARRIPKPIARRKAALGASVRARLPPAAGARIAVLTAHQATKRLNVPRPMASGV